MYAKKWEGTSETISNQDNLMQDVILASMN
jgi:hypothetical protein